MLVAPQERRNKWKKQDEKKTGDFPKRPGTSTSTKTQLLILHLELFKPYVNNDKNKITSTEEFFSFLKRA